MAFSLVPDISAESGAGKQAPQPLPKVVALLGLLAGGSLPSILMADSIVLDCVDSYKLDTSWFLGRKTLFHANLNEAEWIEGCGRSYDYSLENNVATCVYSRKATYRRDTSRKAGVAGGRLVSSRKTKDGIETMCFDENSPSCEYVGGYKVPVIQRRNDGGDWIDLTLGRRVALSYDYRSIYEEAESLDLPDTWTKVVTSEKKINFDLARYNWTSQTEFYAEGEIIHTSNPNTSYFDCKRIEP